MTTDDVQQTIPSQHPSPDAKEVQVARITARQAIIVAAITAVAGLLGAVISSSLHTDTVKASTQHFIKMPTRIAGLPEGTSIRIVADVNGQGYSYPTHFVWADVKSDMAIERFPLPVGQSEYNVEVSVFIRGDKGEIVLARTNPRKITVNDNKEPQANECVAFPSDGFLRTHPLVSVFYEVE